MVNEKVKKVVEKYASAVLGYYRYKLAEGGAIATGKLFDTAECRADFQEEGNGLHFRVIIELEEYWKNVEYGRAPGTWPPVDAIRAWIDSRPVIPRPYKLKNGKTYVPDQKQLAFLIGRKIAEKGIPARPYLKQVKEELEEEFAEELMEAINRALVEEINNFRS